MKLPRITAACGLVLALGCETTPDDPLGHYGYVEPVRDLLPLFAAWDTSLPGNEHIVLRGSEVASISAPLYAAHR
jgi:hypothetical protein